MRSRLQRSSKRTFLTPQILFINGIIYQILCSGCVKLVEIPFNNTTALSGKLILCLHLGFCLTDGPMTPDAGRHNAVFKSSLSL